MEESELSFRVAYIQRGPNSEALNLGGKFCGETPFSSANAMPLKRDITARDIITSANDVSLSFFVYTFSYSVKNCFIISTTQTG